MSEENDEEEEKKLNIYNKIIFKLDRVISFF